MMTSEDKSKVFVAAREGKAITLWAILSNRSTFEVRHLLEHLTEEEGQKTTPFVIAARNGHDKVVKMLLHNFRVDIEQTGTVKFDGFTIEGATGLWSASGAGHFDVVKTLVENNANVNHPTLTNSTPLRAACFDGRLDIVSYLIAHAADIHYPNKFNNTCLMIASYKGHSLVVRYLLEQGANPDVKAHCGATALHFAAERGHLDIVRNLVEYGAEMQANAQQLSPLHIAAESSQGKIVEFFISHSQCEKCTRIEALELLGASYANDKDNYDIEKCYQYLWLAMQERFLDPNEVIYKKILSPLEAYGSQLESANVQELETKKHDADALHMEALILRERILGEDNIETPHPIIFRGAVFADRARFDRCIALWMRALLLRFKNNRSISKDILRFAQVFSQMLHLGVGVGFNVAEKILEVGLHELERDLVRIQNRGNTDEEGQLCNELYEINIHTVVYLIAILFKVKTDEKEDLRLCKLTYKYMKLEVFVKSKHGISPLHMVCDENTSVDDFHVSDVVHFPNDGLVRLLLRCGADPNAVDDLGNTPLHVIVQYNRPISDFMNLHNCIMHLMDAGCHADRTNFAHETAAQAATTGVADIILRTRRQISLKCLAAIAVKTHQIAYQGQIPHHLEEFVAIH